MADKQGTFLVTEVDGDRAVLSDVTDGQIHPVEGHPDLEPEEVLEATLATEPPLDVVWRVDSLHERRRIEVTVADERPTRTSREIAESLAVGDLDRRERADYGEIHVLRVPAEETHAAAEDVAADIQTVSRAARLGVRRVEIRAADGVLSVRYLP